MIEQEVFGKKLLVPDTAWTLRLLGLVSGHWDIKQKAETQGDIVGEIRTAINSGIAIVTPAEAIQDLLDREDVVADRHERVEKTKEKQKAARAITPDTANENEFQRFEDLTKRLLETPKPEKEPRD
jgi:hypothetical protein